MRSLRSIGVTLFLALLGLGLVASTPSRADAKYNYWYGWRNYPYYWNNYSNPYSAYNSYYNWNGRYGGYYGSYPYYSSYRAYPWGWYY